jgi:hypothetical protein
MSHFLSISAPSEKEQKKRKVGYLKGGQGLGQVLSDIRVMLAIQVFLNSDMEKCVNEERQGKVPRRKKKRRKMCLGSTSTEPIEMGTLLQYVIPSSQKKQRPFPYVLFS